MPKGKISKNPAARSFRNKARKKEEFKTRGERPRPVTRQFKAGETYKIPTPDGGLKYFKAGEGGNLIRTAAPPPKRSFFRRAE